MIKKTERKQENKYSEENLKKQQRQKKSSSRNLTFTWIFTSGSVVHLSNVHLYNTRDMSWDLCLSLRLENVTTTKLQESLTNSKIQIIHTGRFFMCVFTFFNFSFYLNHKELINSYSIKLSWNVALSKLNFIKQIKNK